MNKVFLSFSVFCVVLLAAPQVKAADCMLVISYPDGTVLREDGDCNQRRSPASTFKVPLAVMGFDSGVLTSADMPSWPYHDDYNAGMETQKKTTTPRIWMDESIVWFSQQLTRKMGSEKFADYVHIFQYGNEDVSGNPEKNDGLTKSWLFSSLLVSPREQAAFLQKLLNRTLGASTQAQDAAIAIMPEFKAGEWAVFGKTGSGWLRNSSGVYDKSKPQGWFVGWADNGKQKIIFAKLMLGDKPSSQYGGPKARDIFLADLAGGMVDE